MKKINHSARIKNCFLFSTAITLLLFNSCSNSTEPDENYLIDQVPVIKGINITLSWGTSEFFTWRKPDYSPDEKYTNQRLNMQNPYPNPSNYRTRIEFTNENTEQVSLWLAKGILPEEISGENLIQSAGGVSVISGDAAEPYIIKLIENETISGTTDVTWYGLDERGHEAPGGFYRVYLKMGKILLWRDILFARTEDEVHPELRRYLTFYE